MKIFSIALLVFGFASAVTAMELEPAGVMVGQGGSNICLYKEAGTDTVVYTLHSSTPCPKL